MARISFLFKNLKTFSTNKSVNFNKKGKYYKSSKKDDFQKRIYCEMLRHRPEIFDFEAQFSPFEHVLIGNVYMFIPKKSLITKKDCINLNSGDVNNNKVLTDCVFKAFNKLDDAYLITEPPLKLFSPDENYHLAYSIEIEDKENLDVWSENAWSLVGL